MAPATADSADSLVQNPPSVFDPILPPQGDGVATGPGDPLMAPIAGLPPGDPATDPPTALVDPVVMTPPPSDPAVVQPLAPDDSLLDLVAQVSADARLLVSATVLAIAASALIAPRGGGTGMANAGMAFRNVRLLPCLMKASLDRHVAALTQIVGTPGGAGVLGVGGPAGGVLAAHGHGTAPGDDALSDLTGALANLMGDVREGFAEAIRDTEEGFSEQLRDSRLMVQIGMLLGLAYLGFLSIWFWATRRRLEARR
jgi:hypothetical protein